MTAQDHQGTPRTGACARYWGSDGTLCSTHHGRFASGYSVRCDRRAGDRPEAPRSPDWVYHAGVGHPRGVKCRTCAASRVSSAGDKAEAPLDPLFEATISAYEQSGLPGDWGRAQQMKRERALGIPVSDYSTDPLRERNARND